MKTKSAEEALDFTTNVPATTIRRQLSIRAISAWEGYKCCVRGRNIASRFADEVGDVIGNFWHYMRTKGPNPNPAAYIYPSTVFPKTAPMPGDAPKRYHGAPQRTPWPFLLVGVLLIEGWTESAWTVEAEFPVPEAKPQAEAMAQVARATAQSLRRKTESDCYWCIRRKLWGQKKLRRTVTILSSTNLKSKQSTRSIGDRKLNLRTPHR